MIDMDHSLWAYLEGVSSSWHLLAASADWSDIDDEDLDELLSASGDRFDSWEAIAQVYGLDPGCDRNTPDGVVEFITAVW